MKGLTCWVCGAPLVEEEVMLAEVVMVADSGSGGRVVDRVFVRVEVCQPCAVEARRRTLRPLTDIRAVAHGRAAPAYPR